MQLHNKGFSLVELMVVISVIAVLMAVITVSFTTAQRKGRDTVRREDIGTIQKALEQYFVTNGNYPTGSGCSAVTSTADFLPAGMPTDPRPTANYTITCDATGSTYCICAGLETEVGNSDTNACAFDTSGDEDNYCLINQQ